MGVMLLTVGCIYLHMLNSVPAFHMTACDMLPLLNDCFKLRHPKVNIDGVEVMDYRKAFDSVLHKRLIDKLKTYAITAVKPKHQPGPGHVKITLDITAVDVDLLFFTLPVQ